MKTFQKIIGVQNKTEVELVPEEMLSHAQVGGSIETQPEPPRGNAIRQHAADRQRKLLTVILQLAKSNAYTDELQIQLKNGSVLEPNQFISLLNYALSPGKALAGVNDFVEILYQAKVTPEMLINENVKLLLRELYQKQGRPSYSTAETQTGSIPKNNQDTQTGGIGSYTQETQTDSNLRSTTETQTSIQGPSQGSVIPRLFKAARKSQELTPSSTDTDVRNDGPSTNKSIYDTSGIPEPPDEDFDDEPIVMENPYEYSKQRATKRKGTDIVDQGLRRSSRTRMEPNRLQVGRGWEAYDSDDEV